MPPRRVFSQILFQSTRPRGARQYLDREIQTPRSFNPRARGGRDQVNNNNKSRYEHVSIHAPAGGATDGMTGRNFVLKFQSTRPRGARQTSIPCVGNYLLFQSTRPRGARRTTPALSTIHPSFNPRARGGRDFSVHPSIRL